MTIIKPKSPCSVDCTRRVVGCHSSSICEEWGEYEIQMDKYNEEKTKLYNLSRSVLGYYSESQTKRYRKLKNY